jgi:hypothetical protein
MTKFLVFLLVLLLAGCGGPTAQEIKKTLNETSPATHEELRDGIAAIIVMDVSGSMADSVKNAQGAQEAKLAIAKRSLLALVKQFLDYSEAHKDKTLQLGIVVFSGDQEEILPLSAPDIKKTEALIANIKVRGGTQIGDAMIFAKKKADLSKLSKVHILTITDGENGGGADPANVVLEFSKLVVPPSTYLIGFDVASSSFAAVKNNGGVVLSANNETDLLQTLNFVLEKKILLEKPE